MFKNYFQGIQGIDIYPIFLLIVFVAFFTGMTIWLIRANKKQMEELGNIPLSNDNDSTTND